MTIKMGLGAGVEAKKCSLGLSLSPELGPMLHNLLQSQGHAFSATNDNDTLIPRRLISPFHWQLWQPKEVLEISSALNELQAQLVTWMPAPSRREKMALGMGAKMQPGKLHLAYRKPQGSWRGPSCALPASASRGHQSGTRSEIQACFPSKILLYGGILLEGSIGFIRL